MRQPIDNTNIIEIGPLVTPREVKERLPSTPASEACVVQARQAIRDILHGRDRHRLLVIVGPCSIHDPDSACEYAERLHRVANAVRDHLLILMRTYFEKPRTTVGWKGLINDPHLDGSCDIAAGYHIARRILLYINNLGLPCATEFLDPVTPQYLSDLVSWAAVGARTTESQTHREMASGLSMPVGFKNGTDGSLQVALNAMIAARHPQSFIGINVDGQTSIIKTNGNPDRHIVLRGGGGRVNYQAHDIELAAKSIPDEDIARPIMVDCSHGNSGKDHTRQVQVARSVIQQFRDGQHAIMGLLLESHLKPGNQKWEKGKALEYGVSITDACLGWEETESLLYEMVESLKEHGPQPISS
ncbi:MAG: 3-deoxy-7-phosphoheptulonate synthase [Nitrospirae bacterium]|nr:MAG: 3-deoxy-7-phosphoheptulonate synthase [Nitrospirota bacterium]